jgi:TolA-binding protein
MPLSPEADQAWSELSKMAAANTPPPFSFAQRKTRADLLLKGRRYVEAVNEFIGLLREVSPQDRPTMQLAAAVAMRRSGRTADAKRALESLSASTPEIEAERLYNLGEIARTANDQDGFLRYLAQLRQAAPTSPWLGEALLAAGNIYLLKPDYDKAIDYYRELQQRFPASSKASYAHWKVAWLSLRQGRNSEAKQEFEQQIALYSSGGQTPAALYWRGRLAEEDNDFATARAYYQTLSSRFQNYYYGVLARRRLSKVKKDEEPVHIKRRDVKSKKMKSRFTSRCLIAFRPLRIIRKSSLTKFLLTI